MTSGTLRISKSLFGRGYPAAAAQLDNPVAEPLVHPRAKVRAQVGWEHTSAVAVAVPGHLADGMNAGPCKIGVPCPPGQAACAIKHLIH